MQKQKTELNDKIKHLIPPLSILSGLAIWELLVRVSNYPPFILPAPSQIFMRFLKSLQSGVLLYHTGITMVEVAAGLVFGMLMALGTGYYLAKHPVAESILFPYIIASQSVPLAAIAPLLVIWFGSGMAPKVVICTLVVFFPIQVSVIVGLRDIPRNFRDLMRSMEASPQATLRYLEIPAATPVVFSGLRISATLSVLGAVVGELTGADAGLGYLINTARGQYDTSMVFVAVIMLMFMAISLYSAIVALERHMLRWQTIK